MFNYKLFVVGVAVGTLCLTSVMAQADSHYSKIVKTELETSSSTTTDTRIGDAAIATADDSNDSSSTTTSTTSTSSSPHANLTWQGPGTCLACHTDKAKEVHASAHYQWQGAAPYMVNGAAQQGKLKTAMNSYCINIMGNWNGCGACHVGLGAQPNPTTNPTQTDLQNIDCLICHQKDYKRVKVNGVFVPDTANMTITMDQAVQTVHKPVRANCIQCHAKGGGGDNYKRGDMAVAHANTTDKVFDYHMSTSGKNLTCQQCHTTKNHRIAGRGSDLRETDLDVKVTCTNCHSSKASLTTGHSSTDISHHVSRVACQTCHIPVFAKNAADTTATEATEIYRTWVTPEWNATLNRWEPTITKANNVKPVYRFWNGYSWGYSLYDVATMNPATGNYPTSYPIGAINDANSKLYPFKYKTAEAPYDVTRGTLIALATNVYFSTGKYTDATLQGLINMGYSTADQYRAVKTETWQLITHEVPPKSYALQCSACHTSSATQMNLKSMGYVLKADSRTVCSQCHGYKDPTKISYTSLHSKHVASKKYDCSKCHNFSRPERGLKM